MEKRSTTGAWESFSTNFLSAVFRSSEKLPKVSRPTIAQRSGRFQFCHFRIICTRRERCSD